ncbi:MAG TPA: trypsin-like serine protease [Bdellovibrionota bacterium]|jgi:hypothetical protein|nr:trypsin-like serine protease [Bdellovibrionota bacterium]
MKPLFHLLLGVLAVTVSSSAMASGKKPPKYPEVVQIFSSVSFDGRSPWPGRCTGTVIAPRFILTASHCVRHFNHEKFNGQVVWYTDMQNHTVPDQTARPDQVYIQVAGGIGGHKLHPTVVHVSDAAVPVNRPDLSLDYVEQDLAILEFGQDLPYAPRAISDEDAVVGLPVVMLGYGRHGGGEISPSSYQGHNTVDQVELDMVVTDGAAAACDDPAAHVNDWSICPGDSGGPLLNVHNGKIMGVASASGVTPAGRAHSIYIDVTEGPGADFVHQVTGLSGF